MTDALKDPQDARLPLTDFTPEEIAEHLKLKPFQGRQIFSWLHRKKVFDFDEMTDLSKELRKRLNETCRAHCLSLSEVVESSKSNTKKVLLSLSDGETIESVLIPDRERSTLCISTQVGCAVKCSFCATGLSGYARNLSPGEIVEQALYLLRGVDIADRTPNIVYMGMGEPFRNYEATVASIRLLMHPDGLGIGARKITVSTVGEVPGILRFARENWQVRLSVSLHAANDTLRDQLVPLNRKYNLERLMNAVEEYTTITDRQISFEWALLAGVNDSETDAEELAALVGPLNPFINLIPYNPVHGLSYAPPPRRQSEKFRGILARRGLKATLRLERGQDIDAACGQLRRRTLV